MKKYYFLIIVALILGLVLTGCSLLSNISQVPATEQSGIAYLTKGSSPDLVGLWHFDEGSDLYAYDSSGYDNNGTLHNFLVPYGWVTGMFGQALSFDGANDYVDCGAIVDNTITTALTIEVWLYYNTPAQLGGILSNDIPFLSQKGFNLGLWNDGKIYWDVGNGTVLGRTSYAMPASGWHYVVGTWDGSTVTLYVDGASVGTASLNGLYADPNQGLWIGKCNNVSYPTHNYPFNGLIDEVRIWKTALTAGEITYNYDLRNVLIDIKPGGNPNSINLGSNGVIPVAILGSAIFNADTVDPLTVKLAGAGVKLKGNSGNAGSLEDVNDDGYLDLVVQVYTENLGLATGDVIAVLNAYTYAGPALTGSDLIRIVPQE